MYIRNIQKAMVGKGVLTNGTTYLVGADGLIRDTLGQAVDVPPEDAARLLNPPKSNWREVPADKVAAVVATASASPIKFCSACGAPVSAGQRFCAQCGAELPGVAAAPPVPQPKAPPKKKPAPPAPPADPPTDDDESGDEDPPADDGDEPDDPAGSTPQADPPPPTATKATDPPIPAEGEPWPDPTEDMSKAYLQAMADAYEVPYKPKTTRKQLVELCAAAQYED